MLKNETIKELERAFNNVSDLNDIIPDANAIEVVNLDLVRVHINARGSRSYAAAIVEILHNNNEPGPLRIHEEAAKSCNLLYYIDIIQI